QKHASELSQEVTENHISLYVNDFSIELGDEGEKAVSTLMKRAAKDGLVPTLLAPIFAPTFPAKAHQSPLPPEI
ncbi:MAG: hypothetical protein MI742_06730, partial [Desulfobacterales bacterium]|nr:hypothetical protein [Desulfobacterales bacterium]